MNRIQEVAKITDSSFMCMGNQNARVYRVRAEYNNV